MTLGDFSQQARAYHKARPNYPPQLIDHLLLDTQTHSDDPIVDIGAGTGIFTRQLADRNLRVTAIEPNKKMRDLGQSIPTPTSATTQTIHWLPGRFESLPLPDHSQRWAVAAQAFHWADPPLALREIHRVLAPSRCFTILWNNRLNDESPLLAETWATIKHALPDFEDNYRQRDWDHVLVSTGYFHRVRFDQQRHVIAMAPARFLHLWQSHNRLNVHAGPRRIKHILQKIESLIADAKSIEVPYLCKAWTAERRNR